MIAKSFKSVAWVAAIGAAALICYMFSLQVAEERASLAALDAQVSRVEQSIRTLKTELGTRGRVHQLQHWASADFGFTSPKAGQFVENDVSLARFDMPAETPALEAPVRMAQAQAPAPQMPKVVQVAAPAPAPARPAVRQASAPREQQPLLRQASIKTDAPPAPARRAAAPPAASASRAAARPAPRPPAAKPASRPSADLVSPNTLREINSRASTERRAD